MADTVRFRPEDLVDRVPDPGWYQVAVGGVWKRPTDTGSVAVKVKFVITEEGDFEDVELWDQFVVEGASDEGEHVARRRLSRLMRASGIAVEPNVDIPLSSLEGLGLTVNIVPETFRGQSRARVKSYRPVREVHA